ncbi:hypothetical protein T439DRAFT_346165 [Meredithblackwellia eburnea MCA 4105]
MGQTANEGQIRKVRGQTQRALGRAPRRPPSPLFAPIVRPYLLPFALANSRPAVLLAHLARLAMLLAGTACHLTQTQPRLWGNLTTTPHSTSHPSAFENKSLSNNRRNRKRPRNPSFALQLARPSPTPQLSSACITTQLHSQIPLNLRPSAPPPRVSYLDPWTSSSNIHNSLPASVRRTLELLRSASPANTSSLVKFQLASRSFSPSVNMERCPVKSSSHRHVTVDTSDSLLRLELRRTPFVTAPTLPLPRLVLALMPIFIVVILPLFTCIRPDSTPMLLTKPSYATIYSALDVD